MALTQRTVETQVSIPSAAFTLVAKASPDRIYLCISSNPTSPVLAASTKKTTDPTKAAIITTGTAGLPRWEIFRALHGKMVQEEWYIAPGGGVGNFFITVFEVFEEETGYLRTPSGLYLPDANSPLDYLTATSMDRARVLERQLDKARRELKNGSATY